MGRTPRAPHVLGDSPWPLGGVVRTPPPHLTQGARGDTHPIRACADRTRSAATGTRPGPRVPVWGARRCFPHRLTQTPGLGGGGPGPPSPGSLPGALSPCPGRWAKSRRRQGRSIHPFPVTAPNGRPGADWRPAGASSGEQDPSGSPPRRRAHVRAGPAASSASSPRGRRAAGTLGLDKRADLSHGQVGFESLEPGAWKTSATRRPAGGQTPSLWQRPGAWSQTGWGGSLGWGSGSPWGQRVWIWGDHTEGFRV